MLQTTLREPLLALLEYRLKNTCVKVKEPLRDLIECEPTKRQLIRYFAMMVDERSKNLTGGRVTMNE